MHHTPIRENLAYSALFILPLINTVLWWCCIVQAQFEWCLCGEVRGCTGRWLVVSLDAALLHGLRCLARGYWPAVAPLLDRTTLATISALPYATTSLARGTVTFFLY